MELKVLNNKGKESNAVQFDETVLGEKISTVLLHEVVVAHQANKRSGTHSAKTRAEVSGGGSKPWRQKGTGRARAGSIRSPLWRTGGVIFAPKPRDYRQDLPKKKKQLAFRMAVKSLVQSERLQVVEPIEISEPKTKHVAAVYKKWQAPAGSLFVMEKVNPQFVQAARNVANVKFTDAASLNTYDCLKARRVYVTPNALTQLSERCGKKGSPVQ